MRSGKRKMPSNSYFIFWYFGSFSHKRNIFTVSIINDDNRREQTDF